MTKPLAVGALTILSLVAAGTASAQSFYTDESAFDAAAAPFGARKIESFEALPDSSTSTSLSFGPVTFSCVGTTYCPGFFGQSTLYSTDGANSVYGATPDAMVFTFKSKISAFAIDTIGLADVGATSFSIALSDGSSSVLFSNLSQADGAVNFVGAVDAGGITSVTFTGTQPGDGVFYDRLQYVDAVAAAVPEPSACALILAGLGAMGYVSRRRPR